MAFFASLFCLIFLSIFNGLLLPLLWDAVAQERWLMFLMGLVIGGWFGATMIRGHHRVLAHEVKHAIFSSFAGNRSKGMKIGEETGHFKYQYTKHTAGSNSFIALAPYWFPLFTLPALLLSFAFHDNAPAALVIIGVAYGADLVLGLREIAPHQSDLTEITGGYYIALIYLATMIFTVFSYIAAWVSQGAYGIKFLFLGLYEIVLKLFVYYRTAAREAGEQALLLW